VTPEAERNDPDLAPLLDLSDHRRFERTVDDSDMLLARLGAALPRPPSVLIGLIVTLATAQLVIVVPWLMDYDPFGLLDSSTSSHLVRDGALGLVVAVAALLTAWRPRWALPCFTISAITLVAQAVASLVDNDSTASSGGELIHVPAVILTCLVALSAMPLSALGPIRHRTP
jgi:hypothetical protein